ncbi:hypothetical protein ACFRCQ_18060 [Cytobacillus firmus]|uniref:hypothetical protein n=1 Tax=Cytobacillus firmus TaxID=1399 RepID=UPI0004B33613|nr:hypothetical protein [Cytobacillus firmus]
MTESERKLYELGVHAKALLDLSLEAPQTFNPKLIVDRLFNRYEELQFDLDQKEKQ